METTSSRKTSPIAYLYSNLLLISLIFIFFLTTTTDMSNSTCIPFLTDDRIPLLVFLQRLQRTAFSTIGHSPDFDPKRFVDLSLKFDLSSTEKAFNNFTDRSSSISPEELDSFIQTYFYEAGDDLLPVIPVDFSDQPEGFLPLVTDPDVRAWALEVHALWRNLSRCVSSDVLQNPRKHTLLNLPKPGIIAGSRFREVYYWDSFWIVRGLIASKMYETAKGIVTNLVSFIQDYGHVLNGARAYYTNRSQPPLLSAMIRVIYENTGDVEMVKRFLPALVKEHLFWTSDLHEVKIKDVHGCIHSLSRYNARWNKPRPESATIDEGYASKLPTACLKEKFYWQTASTAESGWDFSTRFMRDPSDMTTMATTYIIPVDLNAFILGMELNIAFFASAAGNQELEHKFSLLSQARERGIQSVLWNEEKAQWFDYWLKRDSDHEELHVWEAGGQSHSTFACNFFPIWVGPYHSDDTLVDKVVKSFKNSGLLHAAGIATSLADSTNQWDGTNGWPPVQHVIVEGLAKSKSGEARALAVDVMKRWIRTNYVAYRRTNHMHEKYDVGGYGRLGTGGEYDRQTGFGWSNGVVLSFLEDFGWSEKIDIIEEYS